MRKTKVVFISCVISIITSACIIVLMLVTYNAKKPMSSNEIYLSAIKSVVELKSTTEDDNSLYGSAVIINKEGVISTNAHMVIYKKSGKYHEFSKFEIRFSSDLEYYESKLLKYDQQKDIALLKIVDNSLLTLHLMNFENDSYLKTGSTVYAVGNALNQGLSITKGIISLSRVNIEYDNFVREMIQCNLTINEGNSGGALLNEYGKMIGMPSFRLKENNEIIYGIAYCIPSNDILQFYNSLYLES